MNKTHISVRKVFLLMNKLDKNVSDIAKSVGLSIRTIYNWKALVKKDGGEEKLLSEPASSTRKPTFIVADLKLRIEQNPFEFNKELAIVFGKSDSTIQRWRHKLGFKRKKAKTTYREANLELKKTLKLP